MVKIAFLEPSGAQHVITARPGGSVMEAALANNVPGIEAQCYGACNCATCHVYVHPAWLARLGPKAEPERELLEALPQATPESRLSCQITIKDTLDGLELRLPAFQGPGGAA